MSLVNLFWFMIKSKLAFHCRSFSPVRKGLSRTFETATRQPSMPSHSERRAVRDFLLGSVRTWTLERFFSGAMRFQASIARSISGFWETPDGSLTVLLRLIDVSCCNSVLHTKSLCATCSVAVCNILCNSVLCSTELHSSLQLRSRMIMSVVRVPSTR